MANIQVNRGETKLGIFSEEEIKEGLRAGRFLPNDIGWREGMTTWQMLSEFPEFANLEAQVVGSTIVASSGLPWDRRQELGFFPAFFETLKLVLLNPSEAFSRMKPEGGLGEPLIYGLVGGSIGLLFYLLFSIFMSSFGIMSDRNALAGLFGLGIGTVFGIILMPVFLVFGLFLWSAILHLCLMLVGGAQRSFETTFRVVCFATGSTYPLMIVPVCGGLISGVWCIVAECIGLTKSHPTSTGRALLAIFLPLIVCCGGGFVLAVMFGLFGALSGH